MKRPLSQRLTSFFREEDAQVLPIIALMMVVLMGIAGLVIDMGHIYYSYNELVGATNAAALAAAEVLPGSTAVSVATQYSAVAGNLNAHANLPNVSMVSGYPKASCLQTLVNEAVPCVAPANANAIIVKQQVVVHNFFASLFGFNTTTLTATATAAMRGGYTPPYNVVIIIDATGSMSSTDSSKTCNNTRLSCALSGVRMLLAELYPCGASESTCGTATNGVVANSVDNVSIFSFPNVTQSTVSRDYTCSSGGGGGWGGWGGGGGSSNPTPAPYTFPTAGASSYAPASSTATYRIIDFSSDYRTSDAATSLNTASNLTIAAGGKSGCSGMGNPGGEGTYLAGAIYAAQAALVYEKANNPGSQNVIVLLSDGDASASSSAMTGASTSTGLYPSTKNQCQQAVTASQAATTAGTRVYTVAYGASTSGCSTDGGAITPCQTMQQSASSALTFFSDYAATGGSSSCTSSARPTTSLSQIFVQIGADFTTPRLIPNGTT